MKKIQYIAVGAAMLILLLLYFRPVPVKNDEPALIKDSVTVAIVPSDEFTILSDNPLTVKKGNRAEFKISINENYYCVDTDLYKCTEDTIVIDNATSDRSYYIKTAKKCRLTIEEAKGGSVYLSGDALFCAGDAAKITLSPDSNYILTGIKINNEVHPVQNDGVFTFTVLDDCTVQGVFTGVEKNFIICKKNIGNIEINGNSNDGHFLYGDELVLSVVESEGIIFKGWSKDAYLNDGGVLVSKDTEYHFVLTEDTEIFANFVDTNTYSAFFVSNPLTGKKTEFARLSPEEYGSLPIYYDVPLRDGFVLTGFNTKPDMSGESYGVGSMFRMEHSDMVFYPEWVQAASPDTLKYKKSGNAILISGALPEGYSNGTLCIPDMIDGLPVTAIQAGAFKGAEGLRTVIIAPGINSVGDGAFENCKDLKTVYIPETLTSLGDNCFRGCSGFSDLRMLQSYDRIYDLDYDSALADKYMRLKCSEGKRIILVGGSNLCFGIDSEMLLEAFPEYDVVNFSTTFLYGLSPLLDIVSRNVHEGDIVVIAPEYYYQMYCAKETQSFHNWEYIDCNPDILKDIDIRNNQAVLNTLMMYLYNKRLYSPGKVYNSNPAYSRAGFNAYGDLVTNRRNGGLIEPLIPFVSLITDEGMNKINAACRMMTEKGAKCTFSYPSLSLGSYSREGAKSDAMPFINRLSQKLDKECCTVISDFKDYLFDTVYFYDNCYHMTRDGAKLRTGRLIEDITAYLSNTGN